MVHDPHSAITIFVSRLHRRSSLSDAEANALLALRGTTSVVHANSDIVSPGEAPVHACLVLDGLAGRFSQLGDGQRQITALHVSGDMCDLHSLVTPNGGWALQALSPTVILKVPHSQLREIAHAFPNIAEAFWRDCSVDAGVLSQWVVNIGRRDARSRLAHLLCEMAVRLENAGLGSRTAFRLEATQAQLADALGLTAVHVNRTIQALRASGIVSINGHEIRIGDWDALVEMAGFDERYLQIEGWRKAA